MIDLEAIRQRNEHCADVDALIAEVERLRAIVDVLPDGVCTIRRKDGNIVGIFVGPQPEEWNPNDWPLRGFRGRAKLPEKKS